MPRVVYRSLTSLGSAQLGTILKAATLVEFEPARVEVSDLRVEGGRIVARGPNLPRQEGDEVLDVRGRVVMPGLVDAHHHLHATLVRGLASLHSRSVGQGFVEGLEAGLWKLEQALDLDAVQVAAMAGGLEALRAGTTTVFAQHASPRAIDGSLTRVARGLNEVGLRGVLSYAVTDRQGAVAREEALAETVSFAQKARGRFRGRVGAHASFTLSHDGLAGLALAVKESGVGLHMQLAEDPVDERLSFQRYGAVPVARLADAGLLTPETLLAHVLHLSWPELSRVISSGAWLVHCPRANMRLMRGRAPAGKFGARATFGSSSFPSDVWAEAQAGSLRAYDAEQPVDVLRYLANGHRLASLAFGVPVGPLQEGAAADLVLMDYRPTTPLSAENLAGHIEELLGARWVEAVMVDGVWRLWGRRPLSITPEALSARLDEVTPALQARMAATSVDGGGASPVERKAP